MLCQTGGLVSTAIFDLHAGSLRHSSYQIRNFIEYCLFMHTSQKTEAGYTRVRNEVNR